LEEVQRISAAAYITAYEAVIGAAPKPAFEDYGPRIERNEVWLLEVEGEAVGLIVLEERADYLLVYSIAVRPERQRHGYGTRLLQFAEAHARAAGRGEVRLYTNRRMERNLALYRNCGFVEIGTHPHPHRAGDVLVDMAKIVK
jgi:ribosomal protein S18 acetylase RimI-like enzyme